MTLAAAILPQFYSVISPLVVALLCLFAWRNTRADFLIYWIYAHLAGVGVNLVLLLPLPEKPIPFSIFSFGSLCFEILVWMLFFGVLRLKNLRVPLLLALLISAGIGIASVLLSWALDVRLSIVSSMLAVPALIGGGLFLIATTSVLYVATGVMFILRSVNSILFAYLQMTGESPVTLPVNQAATIFVNLVTGLMLVLIAFDNTRRQLDKSVRDAKNEAQLVQAIFDAVPAAAVLMDKDLRIIRANRTALRFFESMRPGTDLIGLHHNEANTGEHSRRIEEWQRQVMREPGIDHGALEFDYRLADGRVGSLRLYSAATLDAEGKVNGLISVGVDVSDHVATERDLLQQRRAAEEANRAKSQFLASMSHELRTPLNAVLGFAEMLKEGYLGMLNKRQAEYAGNIYAAGQHLLSLVSDILDLSRIDAGRYELRREDVRLSDVIEEVLRLIKPIAAARAIAVLVADIDISLSADRRALTQVLINLLGNAVKFSHPKGVVRLRAHQEEGATIIEVTDEGIGMAPEDLRRAGEPFHQGDPFRARHAAGAGLGLAISRHLVELHGGRLDIESGLNKGTTVRVRL